MKKKTLMRVALIAALGLLAALSVLLGLRACQAEEPVRIITPSPNIEVVEPDATPELTPVPADLLPSGEECEPSPAPGDMTPAPASSAQTLHQADYAFILTVKEKQIKVEDNVNERTLEKSPGWLPSSAKPGEDGMCVVYGHRNRNHLLVLEKVQIGDCITVTMPDGMRFTYAISNLEIVQNSSDLRLPALEGKTLVLITCYPFHYSGHAPGKYIVTAVLT